MKDILIDIFSDLHRVFEGKSADFVYAKFIQRYGVYWSNDLLLYVGEEEIKRNRRGFYDFYFDENYPLSARSDPRSGMFVRSPASEGGKIECLLYLALGVEGFAQLAKVRRIVDGRSQAITLNGNALDIDLGAYENDNARIISLMALKEADWDDSLLLPNYENALVAARDALLTAKNVPYDHTALHTLMNVVLCGAHCPRRKPKPVVAEKMSEISTIAGAIRSAAKKLIL